MVTKKPQKNGSPEVCDQHKADFIRLYPEHGTVGTTLRAIGVSSRSTFRYWCNSDEKFRETYENELLPSRRDEWLAKMIAIANGKPGTDVQLRALFGLLKATDHAETKGERWPGDTHLDKLTFCEKNQVEVSGTGEIVLKVVYDDSNRSRSEASQTA